VNGWEVLRLALAAGVVTTLLNLGVTWWREGRKERRSTEQAARYLAMRVAVTLEAFVAETASRVAGNQLHISSEGYAGTSHDELADLDKYPEDADWRSLDPALAERALTLRNEHRWTRQNIAYEAEFEPGRPSSEIRDEEGATLALRAWALAVSLRKHYGIRALDFAVADWDRVQVLQEAADRLAKMKEIQRRAAQEDAG
jgi:hypothetical protein